MMQQCISLSIVFTHEHLYEFKKTELYFHIITSTMRMRPVYNACTATLFLLLFTLHVQCAESKFSISCQLV